MVECAIERAVEEPFDRPHRRLRVIALVASEHSSPQRHRLKVTRVYDERRRKEENVYREHDADHGRRHDTESRERRDARQCGGRERASRRQRRDEDRLRRPSAAIQ